MLPQAGHTWDWHQAGLQQPQQQEQEYQQADFDENMPLTTDDFYDLRDQADDLHRQLQNEGNAREAVEREVEQLRCEKGHLSLRVKSLEKELSDAQANNQELRAAQENRRQDAAAIRELEAQLQSVQSELQQSQQETSDSANKVTECDAKINSLTEQLSDTRDELARAQSTIDMNQSNESEQSTLVNDLTAERDEAFQERDEARDEVSSLRSQLNDQSADQSDQDELGQLQLQLATEQNNASETAKAHTVLQKAHEDSHKETRSLQLQLRELRDENSRLAKAQNSRTEAQKLAELAEEMGEAPTLTAAEAVYLQEEVRQLKAWGEGLEKQLHEAKSDAERARITMKSNKISKVEQAGASVAEGIERAKSSLKRLNAASQPPEAPAVAPAAAPVEQQQPNTAKPTKKKGSQQPNGLQIVSACMIEPVCLVIANRGPQPADLFGCSVVDHVGKSATSTRLTFTTGKNNSGPFVLGPDESMVLWLSPGRSAGLDLEQPNPYHVYGTTVAGGLSKAKMLVDGSDPIILKDPQGVVLSTIVPAKCSAAAHAQALASVVIREPQSMPEPEPQPKTKKTKAKAEAKKPKETKAEKSKAAAKSSAAVLKITSISVSDPESLVITNEGGTTADLEGYCIKDNLNKAAKSNQFVLEVSKNNPGPFTIAPNQSMTFWFSAGRGGVETKSLKNPQNVYATTKSGSIRKQAVLNDDGDKVALFDTKDKVVCEIVTGASDDAEPEEADEAEQDAPNAISITSITSSDPENMVITNQGGSPIDLQDFTVVDNVGKSKESNRFALTKGKLNPGPFVLQPGKSMTFWFSPGRSDGFDFDSKKNPQHFIGTTKSGAIRKQAVVNDDGDVIVLKDVQGNTVAQIVADGKSGGGKKRSQQQADLPPSKRTR